MRLRRIAIAVAVVGVIVGGLLGWHGGDGAGTRVSQVDSRPLVGRGSR